MAENTDLLKWLSSVAGLTNMLVSDKIENPTSAPALLFNITADKGYFIHRITIANDSAITETYVLQVMANGEPEWEELGRISLVPGLTWRADYELALVTGDKLRLAIIEDADATGISISICEYLEQTA